MNPPDLDLANIELRLDVAQGMGISQVNLAFENRQDFLIGDHDQDVVELRMPLTYLDNSLYLLKNWPRNNITLSYDPVTRRVASFVLLTIDKEAAG